MHLIGMLDSPYVRRVAISLQLLGLRFQHSPLSVFRTFEQFRAINPVVKAPTLVTDDGVVLMDSTLILQYAQSLGGVARRHLVPSAPHELARCLRITGLALAACEKNVQIIYEHGLRPAEKLHEPWLQRVTGQLHAAYDALEAELDRRPLDATREGIDEAGVITAVAWHFTQRTPPAVVDAARYPALQAHSQRAEALPEFMAAPHGDGTVQSV